MHSAQQSSRGVVGQQPDVIVVGAGLAGMTAAALVARAGRSVVVLEQAHHLGGRAATNVIDDVHFNLGAHALYARGDACRVLKELEVPFSGHFPSPGRPLVVAGRTTYRIPAGIGSLVGSSLLSLAEKLRLARLFATIGRIDTRALDRVTAQDWIDKTAGHGNLAALLGALFRVSTYVADHERLSAGAAIDQLRSALAGNVLYLDGGWQTLIDGLRSILGGHGAAMITGVRARSVESDASGVKVHLAGGDVLHAQAAILAVPPDVACSLLSVPSDGHLRRWLSGQSQVRAACLDLALRALPRPGDRFALGLDRPTYFSVHSAAARLGPDGVAVVHLMRYMRDDVDEPAAQVEAELENVLDAVQPGWQTHVITRRFLPKLTVAHCFPRADEGGLSSRPDVTLDDRSNVFLAGDWVGSTGMLADAVCASAERAAQQVLSAVSARSSSAFPVNRRESVLDGSF